MVLPALLVGSMVGPAAAGSTGDPSETVELTIEVNEEWTTVTVDHAGAAQANADVTVTAISTAPDRHGPDSVTAFAETLDRDPISHHRDRLADDGLVECERE